MTAPLPTSELAVRVAGQSFAPLPGSPPSNCVRHGDCLQLMAEMPDKSVDAIITDPPYGATANGWDKSGVMLPWWVEARRVCRGAIIMTAMQPFSTDMINAARDWFRYEMVWDKVNKYSNFLQAKRMPLRRHELILVFGERPTTYNPQFVPCERRVGRRGKNGAGGNYGETSRNDVGKIYDVQNPCSVIAIPAHTTRSGLHPTQKPLPLMAYLVVTYTNPGELILDPFCGSGTTCVAAKQHNRRFIGMEKEAKYVAMANRRLAQDALQLEGKAENVKLCEGSGK